MSFLNLGRSLPVNMIKLKTKLFQHQKQAINKIRNLNCFALYMDTGTGKTRTVIEYVKINAIKTVFYFCPVCLKETVRLELEKHIETPKIFIENKEKKLPENKQFYIIGIESINSNRIYLAITDFIQNKNKKDLLCVIDESTYIKSFFAKRTTRLITLFKNIKYKCVMSGTPITQYYQDLFTQIKFLDPSIIPYRSYYGFCQRYLRFHSVYKDYIIGSKNKEELFEFISPYVFQCKKEECLDLPKRIYKKYYCGFTYQERKEYDELKSDYINSIDAIEGNERKYLIFQMFAALHKFSLKKIRDKNKILKEILYANEDKKIIFCKYIKECEEIKKKFKEVVLFTGKQTTKERAKILKNIPYIKYIVMTYGTGSMGLNLAMFSECIFYSQVFKLGQILQASDRLYRIGQTRNVTYHNIYISGSLDSYIFNNLETKKSILQILEDFLKKQNKKGRKNG